MDAQNILSMMATLVPGREEFANFSIVLQNGQEVKCHKIMLAKASPVFCAMMRKECTETKTNQIQLTEFDQDTVESFLDYIYAEEFLVPDQDVIKRTFDKKSKDQWLKNDLLSV